MTRKVLWMAGGLLTASAIIGIGVHLQQRPSRSGLSEAPVQSVSSAASAAPVPTETHSPLLTGRHAPVFRVVTLNAGTVHVPGARPTVVYFMSASCGSCISGEQQLARVAAQTPATVQWLSLDVEPGYDTSAAVLKMARDTRAHWPQAFATNAIINAYHVTQLDTVAVIAKNGTLVYDGALPASRQLRQLTHEAET